MRFSAYLKDRLPAIIIFVVSLLLSLIFLRAYHVITEALAVLCVILTAGAFSVFLWDYLRKKPFYDKLQNCINELDQKYLISEMVTSPDFLEGRILADVLKDCDHSMCDNVALHRRETAEFREYIEMWVHEVKLPVGGLQLMCHNDGNSKYSEQLKRIDDYIENVLYYARSRNAEKDYIIKKTSLKRAFIDTAIRYREELQERGIALSTENLDMDIMTDAKWLGFIFSQLMGNSMKYEATEITVTAEETPDSISLRFRDNGIGIPESDLPYIFEKSFTGENGRTHTRSTGMGLYIVSMLCQKLGHSVSAKSVQGKYTEKIISFGKNDFLDVQ